MTAELKSHCPIIVIRVRIRPLIDSTPLSALGSAMGRAQINLKAYH